MHVFLSICYHKWSITESDYWLNLTIIVLLGSTILHFGLQLSSTTLFQIRRIALCGQSGLENLLLPFCSLEVSLHGCTQFYVLCRELSDYSSLYTMWREKVVWVDDVYCIWNTQWYITLEELEIWATKTTQRKLPPTLNAICLYWGITLQQWLYCKSMKQDWSIHQLLFPIARWLLSSLYLNKKLPISADTTVTLTAVPCLDIALTGEQYHAAAGNELVMTQAVRM